MGCSFGDHLPIKRKQGLPEYITCILFGHLNPQIIKNTKNQNYHSHHCYIFEKLGDLNGSSRMSNMTFPCVNSIQLVPTMEKKGSLCHHFWRNFWKWGPQKLLPQAYFYVAVKKRIPSINESRSRRATPGHTSTTQKMPQNNIIYRKWPEMAESALWKTVETTYLPPKLTNKWGRKTSTFHIERPVQIWPLEVEIPVRAIFPLYL